MQPIAIIGIGCRFPGKASDPDAYWRLLERGKDAICEVPQDRWDLRRFYDPDPDRPGKMHTRKGGFLSDPIDRFDPLFFGISPREAEGLDPQQRLLLEVVWEAIEDAGLQISSLRGSKTAVVIGGFCMDNSLQMLSPFNRQLIDNHSATCASATLLSNRISYTFNLRGPSFTLDTACSSSLVATHWACEAIRAGQASMAFVGGVNIMMRPEFPIMMSKGRFLSQHGHSKAFDRDAAGYARGEGAGIVVLKPLDRALEDNDRIYAVIRGTGVNQDGRTVGIALPNGKAQAELIQEVCNRAEVDPSQIAYVEAHGTGTEAGDPAELGALDSVLSPNRDAGKPFRVGSVKSNMGHLEAAAGVAGLIKAALILHHGKVAPNLHFNNPNPQIPFDRYKLRVPTEVEPLSANGERALAAVNSFGYGGTNAHVVLEAAPSTGVSPVPSVEESERAFLLPLSAQSQEALGDLAGKFAFLLTRQGNNLSLPDLAYNTAFRRSHLSARMSVTAKSKAELLEKLRLVSGGETPQGFAKGEAPDEKPGLAFVFTGMGPQWWAMGRELAQVEPVFGETLRQCDEIFKGISGWSVLEAMGDGEENSRIGETQVAQPANFILQTALTNLLKEWGIVPDAVVGHSIGEVGAAYAAGCLSLEEALAVTYHRSRLQQTAAGKGTMLAASLNEEQVADIKSRYANIDVGAFNSPNSVTLSGAAEVIHEIASELDGESIFNRVLRVEVAYHSYQMDPLLSELKDSLSNLHPSTPTVPIYSTVTTKSVPDALHGPNYWADNVREPVRFFQTARQMLEDGFRHFLQIGPHPVLSGSLRETFLESEIDAHVIDTLIRKEPERECLLSNIGQLYCLGIDPKWAAFTPAKGSFIRLPGYPWQRSRYWKESERSRQYRLGLPGHPFLNERTDDPHPTWNAEANRQFFPYLEDHKLENNAVFAGASYVEAGLALHQELHGDISPRILKNLRFSRVLVVEPKKLQKLSITVDPNTGRYSVSSRYEEEQAEWQNHASGTLISESCAVRPKRVNLENIAKRCPEEIAAKTCYAQLATRGLHYAERFRVIHSFRRGRDQFLVEIQPHPDTEKENGQYLLHPTILDGVFQSIMQMIGGTDLFVPISIPKIRYFKRPEGRCWGYGKITRVGDTFIQSDLALIDEDGEVAVDLDNTLCQIIQREPQETSNVEFLQPSWLASPLKSTFSLNGKTRCLVFAREQAEADTLKSALKKAGLTATVCLPAEEYACKEDGAFSVSPEKPEHFKNLVRDIGSPDELFSIIYLWSLEQPGSFEEISSDNLAEQALPIAYLSSALQELDLEDAIRMLMVTTKPKENGKVLHPLAAFGLTVENETPALRIKHLSIASLDASMLASELLEEKFENAAIVEESKRLVHRLRRLDEEKDTGYDFQKVTVDEQPVELKVLQYGKLDSLTFVPAKRPGPSHDEVEVEVHSCSINYKDLLKVLGHLPIEARRNTYTQDTLGGEIYGKVKRVGRSVTHVKPGQKVFALAPGGYRTYALVPSRYVFAMPGTLNEESPHVLVSYLTAYYGLIYRARLEAGETVLIHSATGGLGLAAIQVAQCQGAEIIATAGNPKKRRFLRSLGIKHVYNSRNLDFADAVKRITKNKGVDVVLNSLSGEALREGLDALAPYGRFIEVGKRDIIENAQIPLRIFNRGITVTAVDIDRLLNENPDLSHRLLQELVDAFNGGTYTAPPTRTFPASEATDAFRLMAQSGHIGKLAIAIKGNKALFHNPQHKAVVRSDGYYLITGGLNGFGLATARHLAQIGARHLILASRRGDDPEVKAEAIKALGGTGAEVQTIGLDVTDASSVERFFEQNIGAGKKLRGIVHSAMVLDDCLVNQLKSGRLRPILEPKVSGARNLYHAMKKFELKPDFFLLYSSVSSLVGNPGQASYVLANGFLDSFAHEMRLQGINATAVNWGVISDTGVVAQDQNLEQILEATGIEGLLSKQALEYLFTTENLKEPQVAVVRVDWSALREGNRAVAEGPAFSDFSVGQQGNLNGANSAIVKEIQALKENQRKSFVASHIAVHLAQILKMPTGKISFTDNISKLGIDSLTSVELTLALKREFGILLTATDLLKYPTISDFAETILRRLALDS